MVSDLHYNVDLKSANTHRTCWVDKKVKPGDVITLKDSDEPVRKWEVIWVGDVPRTTHALGNQRGWHVGGL